MAAGSEDEDITVRLHTWATTEMHFYPQGASGYDNNFFSHLPYSNFLLARVAKLVAHARFLKSTVLIKIGDMFVKFILKGRECDKSSK